jgi:hypothetical protein
MICSEVNCKQIAEYSCICLKSLTCTEHLGSHWGMGSHQLESLFVHLNDSSYEKIEKFIHPLLKQLESALDSCMKHSSNLINQIKASTKQAAQSLHSQHQFLKSLLLKLKGQKVHKKDFNSVWNALNNCGLKDLLDLFHFNEEVKVNPVHTFIKKSILDLTSDQSSSLVSRYFEDSSFRETVFFLSELNQHTFKQACENSNKLIEKIRLNNLNNSLNSDRNEFRIECQSTKDSFSNTFESSSSNSQDIHLEDLSSFFTKEVLVNILKIESALRIKNNLNEKNPERIEIQNMSDLVNRVDVVGCLTNQEILNIFIHRLKLMEKFKVVKQFFLLGQGDVFHSFFEKIKNSPRDKDYQIIFKECLEGKTVHGIQRSVLSDLSFCFDEDIQDVKIQYRFVYPLNVFFNENLVGDLQSIFFGLYSLKKVEFSLKKSFKNTFRSLEEQENLVFNKFFALRFSCIVLVNDLLYFIFEEIVEKVWKNLMQKMNSSPNFEESVALFRETVSNIKAVCGESSKSGQSLRSLISALFQFSSFSETFSSEVNENLKPFSHFSKTIEKMTKLLKSTLIVFISSLDSLRYENISYFRKRLNEFSFLILS